MIFCPGSLAMGERRGFSDERSARGLALSLCGRRCPDLVRHGFLRRRLRRSGRRDTSEQDPTMAIAPDIEAQILRYHYAEKWRLGTIARSCMFTTAPCDACWRKPVAQGGTAARPSRLTPICRSSARRWRRSRADGQSALLDGAASAAIAAARPFSPPDRCHRPRPKAKPICVCAACWRTTQVDWATWHSRSASAAAVDGVRHVPELTRARFFCASS